VAASIKTVMSWILQLMKFTIVVTTENIGITTQAEKKNVFNRNRKVKNIKKGSKSLFIHRKRV